MSKKGSLGLTTDEIVEELVNNDLLNSGGVENEMVLQQMALEEKKELFRGIQKSKELHEMSSRVANQPKLDISSSEFPSLSESVKSASHNKLKLPRKQPAGPKRADSDGSSDKSSSLLNDDKDEFTVVKFTLPYCVGDDAPPLSMPDRPIRPIRNPYFVRKGEHPMNALKRMLAHHDAWKNEYNTEMRKMESRALIEDIEDSDSKGETSSQKSEAIEEKENDTYDFTSESPLRSHKVYSGPKTRETDNVPSPNSRLLQRKTSRDSDCEEVIPILKPEEPKVEEWKTATRPRNKRNKKQEKSKPYESTPDVEFDFDRTLWKTGNQNPSSSTLNNQPQNRRSITRNEVEEEKVQCPICQQSFAISKVENHAATCEGYSSSPMDVEEEN